MDKRSIGNIKYLDGGKAILRVSAGFDDFGQRIQKSKTVVVTSETDAERKLMAFEREVKRAAEKGIKDKVPTTLQELYDIWMTDHVIPNLSPTTKDFYTDLWNRYILEQKKIKRNSRASTIQK